MTSLSLRVNQIHFEETRKLLDSIHHMNENTVEFAIDLARLYVYPQSDFCVQILPHILSVNDDNNSFSLSFPDASEGTRMCLIVTHISPAIHDCHLTFYQEDDYWLINLLFDQFPVNTVPLRPGAIISNYATTRCKLFAHGHGTVRALSFLFL